jgi:hypothetical protein
LVPTYQAPVEGRKTERSVVPLPSKSARTWVRGAGLTVMVTVACADLPLASVTT